MCDTFTDTSCHVSRYLCWLVDRKGDDMHVTVRKSRESIAKHLKALEVPKMTKQELRKKRLAMSRQDEKNRNKAIDNRTNMITVVQDKRNYGVQCGPASNWR